MPWKLWKHQKHNSTLDQATKFVPHSFFCHRLSLITEIVKEAIPEMAITPEGLRQCVQLIDNLEPSQQLILGPPPPNIILWKATETTGFPQPHFLGPPCVSRLQCQGRLVVHNPPTAVMWYSRDGLLPAAKIVLRCSNCSIQYHPDMFGNKKAGFHFTASLSLYWSGALQTHCCSGVSMILSLLVKYSFIATFSSPSL